MAWLIHQALLMGNVMKLNVRVLTGLFHIALLTGLLVFGPVISLSETEAQEGLRFDRQGFACVMENVQKYINIDTNPVVIFIKFCPQTGVTPDMLRPIQRNASPDLPDGSDVAVEPVISFTKDELSCLAEKWQSGFFDTTTGADTVLISDLCGL